MNQYAKTPWAKHLFGILSDHEWHDTEDVIHSVMLTVPPEKAFRRGEGCRQQKDKRPRGPGARVRGDDSDSIAVGARSLAWQTISNHIRLGRIERDDTRIRCLPPQNANNSVS